MDSLAIADEARGEPGFALLTLLSLLGWSVEVMPCPWSSGVVVRARLPGTRCCVSRIGEQVADVAVDVFVTASGLQRPVVS